MTPAKRTRKPRSTATPKTTTARSRTRPEFQLPSDLLYLSEPLLEFRYGQKLAYPRDGLFLFGPSGDVNEVRTVRYGVIGTTEGVRRLRAWTDSVRSFIGVPLPGPRSRAIEPQHVAFPGFSEAFHAG